MLCVTLFAIVGTALDIQSVDTSYHMQDLRVVWSCGGAFKSFDYFSVFLFVCCAHYFGGADTNSGAQHDILEALNLNVAIVVIPGREEAEF